MSTGTEVRILKRTLKANQRVVGDKLRIVTSLSAHIFIRGIESVLAETHGRSETFLECTSASSTMC